MRATDVTAVTAASASPRSPRRLRALGVTVAAAALSSLALAGPANAVWGGPTTTHGTGLGTTPSGAVASKVQTGNYGTGGGPVINGVVRSDVLASVYSNGFLYIGGLFTNVNTSSGTFPANHLARLFASTGLPDTTWTGSADAAVNALALSPDGTKLYVGGAFMTLDGGSTAKHFGALSTADGSVLSWTRGGAPFTAGTVDGDVYSLMASGTKVYLGGDFTTVNTVAANHIVALDSTSGDIVNGWNAGVDNVPYAATPSTDGRVTSLAMSSDASRLFIGGYFNRVGTTVRPSLAALNASTGALVTTFQPTGLVSGTATKGNTPLSLVSTPTHLYVGLGGEHNLLLDYNPVTGGKSRFIDGGDGDFQALALIGGKLYAGGHFHTYIIDSLGYHYYGTKLNGYVVQTQFGVRFDAATGKLDASWQPGIGDWNDPGAKFGVWTISTDGRNLYMGGALSKASSVAHAHLAFYRG